MNLVVHLFVVFPILLCNLFCKVFSNMATYGLEIRFSILMEKTRFHFIA